MIYSIDDSTQKNYFQPLLILLIQPHLIFTCKYTKDCITKKQIFIETIHSLPKHHDSQESQDRFYFYIRENLLHGVQFQPMDSYTIFA